LDWIGYTSKVILAKNSKYDSCKLSGRYDRLLAAWSYVVCESPLFQATM